jgi:signal transduction histidine kinase
MVATTLLVALALSALLADRIFERQQAADIAALLSRELERVTFLLESSTLGQDFLGESSQGLHLQFVGSDGRVIVPSGAPEPLPLATTTTPDTVEYLGARMMVRSAPWRLGTGTVIGTIRLGYDAEQALTSRERLRWALLLAGAVIALVSGVVGVWFVGRELRPLASLARQAAALDPAEPTLSFSPRQDEVGQVGSALVSAVDAIRQRQVSERERLAAIAHELAAPLSVVAGQLESLTEGGSEGHEAHTAALISARDAARELLHTSQDLLTLARGELGVEVQLEYVTLAAVARRIAAEYAGVRLAIDDEGAMLGSHQRLGQMVRNLVRNAVQAASAPAAVEVHVYRSGVRVMLAVTDDGPGLTPEVERRVFDTNFSQRRGGNGLGLPVVRMLAEAHSGSVSVAGNPGTGATFELSFPSLDAQLIEDDVPEDGVDASDREG